MSKICIVFFVSESFDCLSIFVRAFRENGFDVEAIRIPNLWLFELSKKNIRELKLLLEKKSREKFLIFSPQSTELFLREPNITLTYSAYRSWFNAENMRVIPHLWTPIGAPKQVDDFRWTNKPPLRIGFMGRLYNTSRLAAFVSKCPVQFKQWILRGNYLKYPKIVALANDLGLSIAAAGAFARIETIQVLKKNKSKYDVELDIVEKIQFTGLEQELREYANHLKRNTYVVCPRGIENYSFRIYEALSCGRIPVIIDTDVVLPKEIDWDAVSVRVPYVSLENIYEIVRCDYQSRSGSDFVARQAKALSTMAELRTMRWIRDLAKELQSA